MKKKILSILVSMAIIVMTLPVANVAFANHGTPSQHSGDINADGLVNILDIVILVQHVLGVGNGVNQLTGDSLIRADVNINGNDTLGTLNVLDIVGLVNIALS